MLKVTYAEDGVFHIQDAMGVCMTLLVGSRRALLLDTGYGLEPIPAFLRTLTDLPVTVLLTHGHHDHALGARWFSRVLLHPADFGVYRTYTGPAQTARVLSQADERGVKADAAFGHLTCPVPLPLEDSAMDLGDFPVRLLAMPGHTPGSVMVFLPSHSLLLTGDNWNPETWCFFPEAESVQTLLDSLKRTLSLPFAHVLCPHQSVRFPRSALETFVSEMDGDALLHARPTQHGEAMGIRTAVAEKQGFRLVFDYLKAFPGGAP